MADWILGSILILMVISIFIYLRKRKIGGCCGGCHGCQYGGNCSNEQKNEKKHSS